MNEEKFFDMLLNNIPQAYQEAYFFDVYSDRIFEEQQDTLIAEAEAAGLWTADVSVFNAMCESMDLEHEEVFEVISRAQKEWERIVENTSEYIKENNGIRL